MTQPPPPPGSPFPGGQSPHGGLPPLGAESPHAAPTAASASSPAVDKVYDGTLFKGATTHGLLGKRNIRHPAELPLLWVGITLTTLSGIGWWALIGYTTYIWVTLGERPVQDFWQYVEALPFVLQLVVVLPLFPLLAWWVRATLYAQLRTSAVRMSPTQFPEGYRMVVEAARQYGMRKVPDAYVQLGNGVINAFASGHGFRRFVVVHSDLFEVGGSARDPEALRFVIGHEVGHLAAGHVSYFRLVFTNVIRMIPFLGAAFSRSQEYTADNFGYSFAPEGAPGVMGLLSGGKYLGAEVNFHELADRAATDPSFFVHWVNALSSHPVTTWRAHALRDRSRQGALLVRPVGALYASPLPPGSTFSPRYPSPEEAMAMLEAADAQRPAGAGDQFGRFPGADYSHRPGQRELQLARPLVSAPTGRMIRPGPYRDDACDAAPPEDRPAGSR